MVLGFIVLAPAMLIFAEIGIRESLVWVLFALGFFLALGPLLYVILTPDNPSRDWLTRNRQILKWGPFDFELSLLTFLVVAGISVSVWSFTTFVTSQSISKLSAENELLTEEVQKARLFTVLVHLRLPGAVDTNKLGSLQCRYKIYGQQEYKVGRTTAGISNHDIGCVIEDISRGDVINRLNVRATKRRVSRASRIQGEC